MSSKYINKDTIKIGAYLIAGLIAYKFVKKEYYATLQQAQTLVNPNDPDNVVRTTLGIERGGKVDRFFYKVFEAVGL